MTLFGQSLYLILSFLFVFIWRQMGLADFTIPLLGFSILLYLLFFARKKNNPWGIFILNTVVLLLIFSTGSIHSVLFFLLYFLVFGIAFASKPSMVFIFTLGVILIFLPEALRDNVLENLIKLGSLLFISPLAFFFGKEFKNRDEEEEKIESMEERGKEAADTIAQDVEKVLKNEKENLKKDDVEKLNEILEETEDLRQEAKE